MFEAAVKAAKEVFRVGRVQQQFPKLPFVFGAYDFPSAHLRLLQRLKQQEVIIEAEIAYTGLVSWMTKGSERGKRCVSDELRLHAEDCLSVFSKRGIRLEAKSTEIPSSYRLLARHNYCGPYLPFRSLNPSAEDVVAVMSIAALRANNPLYQRLQVQYGSALDRDIDYVLTQFDPLKVLEQIHSGEPLTTFQQEQLHLLHLHLNHVGMVYDDALVAVKHSQRLVVVGEQGEELDGETEPNVHILLLRKITTLAKCSWLARHFPLERWLLADIDFQLDASRLSP